MQMQPINPLGPLVAGAKETRPNSGENFSDSLLTVHGKSDDVSNSQPEVTTAHQDDEHATAHSPISDETTHTPIQPPAKESNGHIEAVAIEKQSSTCGEEDLTTDIMPADGLAGPVATQIQGMVAILPGQNTGTGFLTDITVSNFLQQTAVEMVYPNSESGLQQSTVVMQTMANPTAPQVSFDSANSAILSQIMVGEALPDQFLTTPPQDSETTLLQVHSKLPHSPVQADSLPGRIITGITNDSLLPHDSETTLLQVQGKLPHSPVQADSLPGRIITGITNDSLLPHDSETTLLQVQGKLPHSPVQADSLPGRIISAVANAPYVSDQKTVGPIDLRYVELVQNSETGNLAPSTTQRDGTTTLTDSRFAEILGLTAAPGSETVQRLVPQKQRSWGPGIEAPVTGPAGQKTAARVAAMKISDQFMNDFTTDNPGQDIHWTKPAEGIAASSHTQGTGEPADLLHSMAPSQNTIPTAVLSQEGATARPPTGFGNVIENRIIDHVIQQVSIRSNPKQSSISIRLHPEELGHLKMEIVANNETIKAHIHVQNQQVQDLLEKNLARLREGFEQQGLVLDEIQVSVNSDSKSGPGLFNEQQTLHARPQTANSTRTQESDETSSEETMVAPHRPDSIISLRI